MLTPQAALPYPLQAILTTTQTRIDSLGFCVGIWGPGSLLRLTPEESERMALRCADFSLHEDVPGQWAKLGSLKCKAQGSGPFGLGLRVVLEGII